MARGLSAHHAPFIGPLPAAIQFIAVYSKWCGGMLPVVGLRPDPHACGVAAEHQVSCLMSGVTILGILAGTLTTISFAPQAIKAWRTRRTRDVSLGMFAILCAGTVLWITYGVLTRDLPISLANSVTFVLASSILLLKIKHG